MRKKKILIIEGDIIFARKIERILRGIGYSAKTLIFSGEALLPEIKKERPNLVLTDIMIGDKSRGFDIVKRIQDELDIPVVFVTAHSEMKVIKMALKTNPFGYVLKPINKKNLFIAVAMAIARHSMGKKPTEHMKRVLLESEVRFQQFVDNFSEGIVVLDKHGEVTYVNERFLELIGYKRREDVIGFPITKLLGEGWLRKKEETSPNLTGDQWKSAELAWIRKDGNRVYTIFSSKPIYDIKGRISKTVAVLTDITERRKVETELRRSREELQNLSHHLQSVREKESKRIAGEIHDELGQKLTALKIDLSWLSTRISSFEKGKKEIIEKIAAMSELVDHTIHTVQKISAELRPGLLDDLGLVPAIEWLTQDFQNRTKIKCRLQLCFCDINLDPDRSTAIFRISQEALTNVYRHAKATLVDINLKEQNGALILIINDNGKGIKNSEIFAQNSLGLMGMRERVRPFGGELRITGTPNKGTTLTVTIPLERSPD